MQLSYASRKKKLNQNLEYTVLSFSKNEMLRLPEVARDIQTEICHILIIKDQKNFAANNTFQFAKVSNYIVEEEKKSVQKSRPCI